MSQIAICISGHLRDYDKCWENIKKNFISVLEEYGCNIDYYVSTWNNKGNRENGWLGNVNFNSFINTINPISIKIEQFNREFFIRKYDTGKWREYKHLSSETTSGDAVSMWYKIYDCYKAVLEYEKLYNFKYDCIVRLRSDLLFDNKYNISELENILSNNMIYIPRWHGKWPEVSRTITDYFAIGSRNAMGIYMSVFKNIGNLIKEDCPHTGEGFLSEHIKHLNIKRMTGTGFSIHRVNRIEKIVSARKRILVLITHKTLDENHMEMCLKHISTSKNPFIFDIMYIYNSNQEELPNSKIRKLCNKYSINKLTNEIIDFPYNKNLSKTLGADFINISNFLKNKYSSTDTVLLLKTDSMVSVNLLNELDSIEGESFIATPPFILAKKKVTDEEIFIYTRRESFIRTDDITFFNEDENQSDNNDHKTRDIYDPKITFISCTVKRDFSCHYMTLDILDKTSVSLKPWGGVNFEKCRKNWKSTINGFIVHKYHGVKSNNNISDRIGMNYLYS